MRSQDRPQVVGIIQARMGSSRLPGKVMLPLAGEPMLARVARRAGRARKLDAVVVATTTSPLDDAIPELCEREGWSCARGSEDDVLDRYVQAAKDQRADTVTRITADCPLVDPDLIDEVVDAFERFPCDYASNTLEPRTYPRGLDVEVFSLAALERAWREDRTAETREHVTAYIYQHPGTFRLHRVSASRDLSFHRWTVDTKEDYELVRRIYEHFGSDEFRWTDVLRLLERNPEWVEINRHVQQKVVP